MLQMLLKIRGTVQGVGYRNSVCTKIIKNCPNVTGYIQNLADGSVELLATGSIEELKEVRKIANEGSSFSKVREIEQVQFDPISESEFDEFFIKTQF